MTSTPDLKDPANWIPRDLFRDYCGSDCDALLAYYDHAAAKKNPVVMSFNWLAVLALPAWLGYRQQWTMWLTFVGLIAIVPFIEYPAGFQVPTGAFGGAAIAMGLMARGILLSTATGLYRKLKQQGLKDAAIHEALHDKAATSIPSAFLAVVGAVGLIVGAELLAQFLFLS